MHFLKYSASLRHAYNNQIGWLMTAIPAWKHLGLALLFIPFLIACNNNKAVKKSIRMVKPQVMDNRAARPINSAKTDVKNNPIVMINGKSFSHNKAAVSISNNEINAARKSCGLSTLSEDLELERVAINHANYINHVYANAAPTTFNSHFQNKINNMFAVTGNNNPFFSGDVVKDRLLSVNYSKDSYDVSENIAQSIHFNSMGDIVAPTTATLSMTKSLLAAPYHLRALMKPNLGLLGSSMAAYKPFSKDPSTYQGYVLVNYTTATQATKNTTINGIFTYPCQNLTGTVTALYNETPNPFRDARNLQTNPIGQPIYINMPSAKSIKIQRISFYDVARKIEIPTRLLDANQDPYKNTIYELPANEAFILPLTDQLKSCERNSKANANCGLYGNSDYRVSFDVLIDNKKLVNKSFTFKTGNVNY